MPFVHDMHPMRIRGAMINGPRCGLRFEIAARRSVDEESIRMKPYLSGDDGVKLAVTHTNAVDTGKATHPVAKVRKISMTIGT